MGGAPQWDNGFGDIEAAWRDYVAAMSWGRLLEDRGGAAVGEAERARGEALGRMHGGMGALQQPEGQQGQQGQHLQALPRGATQPRMGRAAAQGCVCVQVGVAPLLARMLACFQGCAAQRTGMAIRPLALAREAALS